MEYRPLNITVMSAHGIKDVTLFSKQDVYVEAWIAGYPQSKKKTPVDKDGATNPKWNHRLDFVVDEPYLTKPGLTLLFHLKHQSTFGSDKEIGSVSVPVNELFRPDYSQDKIVEFQVITPSGKPKGTLKFSYHFGEKFTQQQPQPQPQAEVKKHAGEPVTAYPAQPYAAGGSYTPPPVAYPGAGYPPQQYAAPPPMAGYGAYPPQAGGYPPPGYGYPPAPAGYPPQYAQPQKPKKNKMGMGGGLGLGLGAGLLGGLLVGEMASDIGESAAYADGYGDAMGDMGDFDF